MRLDVFIPWKQRRHRLPQLLKRIGVTWQSAPVRRLTQTACLIVFLALFLWTCWPYDAQPARQWHGWNLDAPAAGGSVTAVAPSETSDLPRAGATVYFANRSSGAEPAAVFGPFAVSGGDHVRLELKPAGETTPEQLAQAASGSGPWTLMEKPPGQWPSHYADNLNAKEFLPAESLLAIDPLVSLSTALAAGSWVWSLTCAAIILLVCVLVPRGFCGYVCPLGTLIDLFDWALGRRVSLFRVSGDGWWVHLKYYLLAGTLVAALCGVLLSGFVAAIPVVTRGMMFLLGPLQIGSLRGWHQAPTWNSGHYLSVVLFFVVLGLGLLRPRFWCRYVCPSGAVFSLGNLLRLSERKVEASCIHCNKCVEICPFDAIKPDFTTRTADCTLCQTCAGVCPQGSIKFVERWNSVQLKPAEDPPTGETAWGRRSFLAWSAGLVSAASGGTVAAMFTKAYGARLGEETVRLPVRPPGSVPERAFLQMCIRCGECFKVCPNSVLQPLGFEQGLEGLWTPAVAADWAGCEAACNACGQVCPTGAIRELPMDEKRAARMGLAVVNTKTCLPYVLEGECQLCVDECKSAGYDAIEFMQVGTAVDEFGRPIEGSGYLAPVVLADKCVGCGLCQTRCYRINALHDHKLEESAIAVRAGEGREDRMMSGSYRELRDRETQQRLEEQQKLMEQQGSGDSYLPEFLQ